MLMMTMWWQHLILLGCLMVTQVCSLWGIYRILRKFAHAEIAIAVKAAVDAATYPTNWATQINLLNQKITIVHDVMGVLVELQQSMVAMAARQLAIQEILTELHPKSGS